MIRLFIGVAPNHEDAESQAVLEWSLHKHASDAVQITWMKLSRDPSSPFYSDPNKGKGWNTSEWATPFTAFRWGIPELCNFNGKAIYCDSDVIFMADPAELFNQQFMPGVVVMAKERSTSRFCVSLWNCAAAAKHAWPLERLQRAPDAHRQMVNVYRRTPSLIQRFSGNWNCLDGETYERLDDPEIKAIHYTSMRHQPQHKYAGPRLALEGRKHWFDGTPEAHWRPDLQKLFDDLLAEAAENGYPVSRYTQDPIFGDIKKRSVSGQGLTRPSWGRNAPTVAA